MSFFSTSESSAKDFVFSKLEPDLGTFFPTVQIQIGFTVRAGLGEFLFNKSQLDLDVQEVAFRLIEKAEGDSVQ